MHGVAPFCQDQPMFRIQSQLPDNPGGGRIAITRVTMKLALSPLTPGSFINYSTLRFAVTLHEPCI